MAARSDSAASASPRRALLAVALLALVLGAALVLALGGSEDAQVGPPQSRLSLAEATAPLEDAPPKLVRIREQANQLLEGGEQAFERRLGRLLGTPVIVNRWASWCGPCIFEFPYFQEAAIAHGDRVAFLGLDSGDAEAAARTFLRDLPVPYPSYLDPDLKLARSIEAEYAPSTIFIGSDGEIAHKQHGPYESEEELLADIDRYAR